MADAEPRRIIEDMSRALERFPNRPAIYFNRGLAHDACGQFRAAIADYSRALELDPGLAQAYLNRGTVYNKSGMLRPAVEDYRAALALLPDSDVNLPRLRLTIQQLDESLRMKGL